MTATTAAANGVSLPALIWRFKLRISLTMLLVVAEAVAWLFFPLMLGFAIDGLLADDYTGVVGLALLSLAALALGAGRRFYDTRAYSGIYSVVATEMVERERARKTGDSAVAARANLLVEFIEFMENSMPMIVSGVIGVVGTLLIIAGIDLSIFIGCLLVVGLTVATYTLTGRLNLRLNKGYNDQLEHQVQAISSFSLAGVARHFRALMRWNVRLSDLETVNYSVIFLGMAALLVYAPVSLIGGGMLEVGIVFAAIVYVFQFIEDLGQMPLYLQQLIRLQEITRRLSSAPAANATEAVAGGNPT